MTKLAGHGEIFAGVHVFTPHADIPDEIGNGPRLVILPPKLENTYVKANEKLAFGVAESILTFRGEQPRMHRNRLFLLAPEQNTLARLLDQGKTYLAWQEIIDDCESGRQNLGVFQVRQAKKDCESAQNAMDQMIRECYRILMIPEQVTPNRIGFEIRRIQPSNASKIANVVEKILLEEEFIIQKWSPLLLKDHLVKHYFKDGKTDFSARRVWLDCCDYLQMPRILNEGVFERTVIDGVNKGDYFGFADGKDGDKYMGFKLGNQVFNLGLDDQALLIEYNTAVAYKEAHAPKPTSTEPGFPLEGEKGAEQAPPVSGSTGSGSNPYSTAPQEMQYRVFNGAAKLKNTNASVALDIVVKSESPFDANTVRAVKENSTALKLINPEFSED